MAKELLKCGRPPKRVVRSRTRDTAPDTPVQVVDEPTDTVPVGHDRED